MKRYLWQVFAPDRAAGRISAARYTTLVSCVQAVLAGAIDKGGTTLRDYVGGDGKPGYFAQQLRVYGRDGLLCRQCTTVLKAIRQNNRATVFCPNVSALGVIFIDQSLSHWWRYKGGNIAA